MSFLGPAILLLCFGAIALSRRSPSLWLAGVLGRTALVALMALSAWFGGLMTGVIRLDWLVHWLGTPKLEPPWDKIAFFGPALVVGAAYFIYEMSRRRTPNPEPRTLNEP
jgi:hypothetical protein